MRAALLAAALVLGGGASAPDEGVETIRYKIDPGFCIGKCPWFDLTVSSNGKVKIRHSLRTGEDERVRYSYVRPHEYAAFRARLAPYRPEGVLSLVDESKCTELMPDAEVFHVTWTGGGPDARLDYDFGCDWDQRREWAEGLRAAVDALNIKDLPGRGRR